VVVWKKDILESAIVLKKIGFNPVVLNPASKEYPGGSVEYGSKAQEEEIFRRTDYCLHLTNDLYPISNPTSIIYSKNVSIIKDINYNYLKNPHYKVDFIACAASLSLDGTLNDKQFEKTRYKIRLIFSSAVEEGRDSIILSALGCGVCNNPVVKIVQIFKEVIEEYKYFFEIIVFSINDHNYKYFLKINE
jgi:uncharacterized protein (TIGR02452 family)